METTKAQKMPNWTLGKQKFGQFLEGMRTSEFMAIDTESNGRDLRYEDGTGKTMGLSVAFRIAEPFEIRTAYFPFRHWDWNYPTEYLTRLKEIIETYEGKVIFHNAKHDLVALQNLEIYYTGRFYDTMLMAHLLNENYFSKGLDYLSKTLLGDRKDRSKEMDGFIKGFGWGMVGSDMIQEYAAHDTFLTLSLFEYFRPAWRKEELDKTVWPYHEKFARLIRKMERRGIRIDQELCGQELKKGRTRMLDISEELGLNPSSPVDLEELLINQMGLPVVRQTPKGAVSFAKEAMQAYEAMLEGRKDETAKLILEYRGWQKTCSSNYQSYLSLVSNDGRVRPNYRMHGTTTGRLSCSDPNLQQIPRQSTNPWNGKLKAAFIPKDGYELWEFDYAQLELRLGAAYAKEEELIEIFQEGRDIFTEMASSLGMSRQDTKTLVYSLNYGAGINRISNVFGVDKERASDIRNNFYNQYPNLREISKRAATIARNKGKIKLWSGRYRHFDRPEEQAHKAFNSVIQGGAADIMMHTMLRLDERIDDSQECRQLLQVHDSVVWEIRSDKVDYFLPEIKQAMEAVEPSFGVRFQVEAKPWYKEIP